MPFDALYVITGLTTKYVRISPWRVLIFRRQPLVLINPIRIAWAAQEATSEAGLVHRTVDFRSNAILMLQLGFPSADLLPFQMALPTTSTPREESCLLKPRPQLVHYLRAPPEFSDIFPVPIAVPAGVVRFRGVVRCECGSR